MTTFRSKFPDVSFPSMSVDEFVMEHFDRYGDRVAMVDGIKGHEYTYRQIKLLVRKVRFGLASMGFKAGDVFAIFSPNCPEFGIVMLGVLSAGGIVTTMNPMFTVDELVYQLKNSEAKYLITVPAFADKVFKAQTKLPSLKEVFVFGEHPGCTSYLSLINNNGQSLPRSKVDPDEVVVLPYSSGTTGLPKGVMLTHRNMISNTYQRSSEHIIKIIPGECYLALLPFFHIYGLSICLLQCLWLGVKIVTLPNFQPETFLRSIQDYKVTALMLVPPLMLFLAKSPLVDRYDLSSVQFIISGAAPLGQELIESIAARLGVKCISQGYGLTETSCAATITPQNDINYGSVGLLLPNTEMKVVDVTSGKLLGPEQDGEIWVKGPQIMKGYLKNPEATAQCIDKDGFFHTGDIGHIDKDGYTHIVDRLKELIKYKGHQVPPAELEALLLTHPEVLDAAVIGVPDQAAGELPRAFVVRKSGGLTTEVVKKYVSDNAAPYKRLRGGVIFLDQIPKSASGKILRRELRKTLKSSL
ncbi:4-coumarate--CoA ligase 1-like isoform X2 [Patiria miniata]|uniref:Luciferin 4-monooxygenase n=1 Tax=Patiria miniata TaxID=46514 RepID=A0A914A146_PATMI|nr:4-coumarate--CoA ligase 1-like isoform X2 [Patiria miniata]